MLTPTENHSEHFIRHKDGIADYAGVSKRAFSEKDYLEVGRKVIAEGTYIPDKDGYFVQFLNSDGKQRFIFVGLKNDSSTITTIHRRDKL